MSLFSNRAAVTDPEAVAELERLTGVVTRSFRHFVEAGDALATIRDRELYKVKAPTFEDFCRDTWGMSRQHAARLIDAANVARTLEPSGFALSCERQARELTGLDPVDQVAAMAEAAASSPTGDIPTSAIAAAAAKRRPKRRRSPKLAKPKRVRVPGGWVIIEPNKKFSGDYRQALVDAVAKLDQQPAIARAA